MKNTICFGRGKGLFFLAVLAAVSFLGGQMTSKFNTEGSTISSAGS